MKRSLRFAALAVVVAGVAGVGCRSGETPTTRGAGPVGAEAPVVVPLVARLVVSPAVVSVSTRPSTRPLGAEPATLRLTLVVSNTTGRNYVGESPDAAVARFAITVDGEPVWSYPGMAGQVVTPVTIGAGQQVTYHAKVEIPDMRVYRGKVLVARGNFSPAGLTTSTAVTVR